MLFRHARQGVRQVKRDHNQGGCNRTDTRIVVFLRSRAANGSGFRCRTIRQRSTWPRSRGVIPDASLCREPDSVHLQRTHDRVLWVFHIDVTNVRARAVRELIERCFEIIEIVDGLAIHFHDNRAPRYRGLRQQVARVGNVDTGWLAVIVPRLLIGQGIDDPITELQILIRRYRMQVIDLHCVCQLPAATFNLDFNLFSDVTIKHGFERYEFGGQLTIHSNENIARREFAGSW